MHPVGRNLRQWPHNKPPLGGPWVRQNEARQVDNSVLIGNQIKIQRPRRIGTATLAPKLRLNIQQKRHDL